MKRAFFIIFAVVLISGCTTTAPLTEPENKPEPKPSAAVFYYSFSDVYISGVRKLMNEQLSALGIPFQNFDANGNQTLQTEQISTAIAGGADLLIVNLVSTFSEDSAHSAVRAAEHADIPIIFFNREVSDEVINSYEKCAYVGTDASEAGYIQGMMIGDHLLTNYKATDLNGDGVISYVLFKGQGGNAEAEYRTKHSVEICNELLSEGGYPPLSFYDEDNSARFLVDPSGHWSAAAAANFMDTILSEYSERKGNMVELVIANNDDMAAGAISSLEAAGYNTGTGRAIPVFGVDAVENARRLIAEGKMTGTVVQDAEGMANTVAYLSKNALSGRDIMAGTNDLNVDEGIKKIRVPYGVYME